MLYQAPLTSSSPPSLTGSPERSASTGAAGPFAAAGRGLAAAVAVSCALLLAACGDPAPESEPETPAPSVEERQPMPDPAEPPPAELTVVFLGDSLTAGYGLDEDEAYPTLAERLLREKGYSVKVINGGVSGDTTAGGLRRLSWLLRQEPDVVLVALGGNDGLRGIDPESSEANLRLILEQSKAAGARVLLAGMLVPPNYGEDYTREFARIFPRLAEDYADGFIPFLLEGVAGDSELNQADGIHPTAEGQKKIAALVAKHLVPLLEETLEEKAADAPTDVLP